MKRIAMAALVVLAAGCLPEGSSKGSPAPVPMVSLSISPASLDLVEGDEQGLTAMASYADGIELPIKASWSADNLCVSVTSEPAAVTQVSAVTYGTAVVTATAGGFSATADVLIAPKLVALAISPATLKLDVGDSMPLTLRGTWSDGTNKPVIGNWDVTGPAASLDAGTGSSVILTGEAYGSAVVVASIPGLSAEATVTVAPTLQAIIVTPPTFSMTFREGVMLEANASYSDGSTTHVNTQWTTSGPEASLDRNQGPQVIASGVTPGIVTITASYGGKSDSCTITISAVYEITPSFRLIAPGGTAVLTSTLDIGDGPVAVESDWTVSGPQVTLDAVKASAVTATAVGLGSVQVTAKSGGRTAKATVTAQPVQGPVFGDTVGGIVRFPDDGGPSVAVGAAPGDKGYGLAVNAAGTKLYSIGSSNPGNQAVHEIYELDLAAPQPAPFIKLADISGCDTPNDGGVYDGPRQLLFDHQGRLYTYGNMNGVVLRVDPSTGVASTAIKNLRGYVGEPGGIAFDNTDTLHATPLLVQGAQWITKVNTWTVGAVTVEASEVFALLPPGISLPFVTGGLAMNDQNEAFTMASLDTKLYKFADKDGDGLAVSEGETTLFAVLPGEFGDGGVYGITAIPGGVLINRKQQSLAAIWPDPRLGIFFAVDLNGDGDALDEGELGRLSEEYIFNGWQTGCLVAPRN